MEVEYGRTSEGFGPSARSRVTQTQSVTITSTEPACRATAAASLFASSTSSRSNPSALSSPCCFMTSASQLTVPNFNTPSLIVPAMAGWKTARRQTSAGINTRMMLTESSVEAMAQTPASWDSEITFNPLHSNAAGPSLVDQLLREGIELRDGDERMRSSA